MITIISQLSVSATYIAVLASLLFLLRTEDSLLACLQANEAMDDENLNGQQIPLSGMHSNICMNSMSTTWQPTYERTVNADSESFLEWWRLHHSAKQSISSMILIGLSRCACGYTFDVMCNNFTMHTEKLPLCVQRPTCNGTTDNCKFYGDTQMWLAAQAYRRCFFQHRPKSDHGSGGKRIWSSNHLGWCFCHGATSTANPTRAINNGRRTALKISY